MRLASRNVSVSTSTQFVQEETERQFRSCHLFEAKRGLQNEMNGGKGRGQLSELTKVVEGRVIQGDKRSGALGFPTANIDGETPELEGVYAGTIDLRVGDDKSRYVTAVSVGRRPTLRDVGARLILEAHILDFTGDLYDQDVRVELHTRLRPQFRYVDAPSLIRQLQLDVEATRAWALANGLEYLLLPPTGFAKTSGPVPGTNGSGPVIRRKKLRGPAKSEERRRLREQRLQQVIHECRDRSQLSPEWLAQRTGLPVGFTRWYLESSQKVISP